MARFVTLPSYPDTWNMVVNADQVLYVKENPDRASCALYFAVPQTQGGPHQLTVKGGLTFVLPVLNGTAR